MRGSQEKAEPLLNGTLCNGLAYFGGGAAHYVVVCHQSFYFRDYLPGYARKKGENLATKEDIGEITKTQEEIKHQFAELIEASKQRHALRTLVAERRMDAHQQAFKLVKQLLSAREDKTVIKDGKEWMDNYCLYLAPEARMAVLKAIGQPDGSSKSCPNWSAFMVRLVTCVRTTAQSSYRRPS